MEQHDGDETLEYIFQVYVIGNSKTGKTSILKWVKGKMLPVQKVILKIILYLICYIGEK